MWKPVRHRDVPEQLNALSSRVIGAAMRVHTSLGPGLLEKPYKVVLASRLEAEGFHVEVERPLPLEVDGIRFHAVYYADLVVDRTLLVEVKAVESITFREITQTKTYLRLGNYPLGLILNFAEPSLRFGITRVLPAPPKPPAPPDPPAPPGFESGRAAGEM